MCVVLQTVVIIHTMVPAGCLCVASVVQRTQRSVGVRDKTRLNAGQLVVDVHTMDFKHDVPGA